MEFQNSKPVRYYKYGHSELEKPIIFGENENHYWNFRCEGTYVYKPENWEYCPKCCMKLEEWNPAVGPMILQFDFTGQAPKNPCVMIMDDNRIVCCSHHNHSFKNGVCNVMRKRFHDMVVVNGFIWKVVNNIV